MTISKERVTRITGLSPHEDIKTLTGEQLSELMGTSYPTLNKTIGVIKELSPPFLSLLRQQPMAVNRLTSLGYSSRLSPRRKKAVSYFSITGRILAREI